MGGELWVLEEFVVAGGVDLFVVSEALAGCDCCV